MTQSDENGWFSEDAATFGDRLAGAREAAGLSQEGLAGQIGVKQSTLDAWENDLREPRANRLQMLSGMLGVSLRWLLTGVGTGPDGPDEEAPITADANAILTEMRRLRIKMANAALKLGQLEKRLRQTLKDAS
tara:strand:- start:303 stop:701 length:399 start_codon:yes stop_codon:yes gene_type:complete